MFISVHESLTAIEIDNNNSNCEVIWAEVQTQGKPNTTGAFYRPPSTKESSLKDLACTIQGIKNKQNKHIVLGGEFNLPHINWKKKSLKAGSNHIYSISSFLIWSKNLALSKYNLALVGKATYYICILPPIQVLLAPATLCQAYLTTS